MPGPQRNGYSEPHPRRISMLGGTVELLADETRRNYMTLARPFRESEPDATQPLRYARGTGVPVCFLIWEICSGLLEAMVVKPCAFLA